MVVYFGEKTDRHFESDYGMKYLIISIRKKKFHSYSFHAHKKIKILLFFKK